MPDCQQVKAKIDEYLRFNFYRTEGYISRLEALMFRDLIAAQVEREYQGALVEIGVHYGRSFFLLASGRYGSEKCLAVDLFEDDALYENRKGVGRLGGFKSNCQRYRCELSENEVVKRSSLELDATEILSRVGSVRFFSIDGGHMYEHVTNDLFLAQEVLTQEGVICLDDMFNALWPEVAIAAFDWVRRTDNKFVPFLATKEKLFLCEPKYVPIYLAAIRADRELNGRMCRKISVLSHEVVVLSSSVASKMVDRVGRLFALSAGIVEGV